MGAYLGQKNTLHARTQEFKESELGKVSSQDIESGTKIFKSGANIFSTIFGNNRGDKRAARDELLERMYQAGVSRSALTGVHSDHVADLQNLAQWIERTGPSAIAYINDTLPAGTGPDWDDKIIAGYSQWKSQQPAGSGNNLPVAITTATMFPSGTGMMLLKIGGTMAVLGGAGYGIYKFTTRKK